MALPLSLTGIAYGPQRNNDLGPYISAAGNVYVVGHTSGNGASIVVFKATDPTSSFAEVDAANNPVLTASALDFSSRQVGDVIHIATIETTSGRVGYHTFNMATDAWVIVNEQVVATARASSTASFVDLAVRDDGDVIVLYSGAQDTITMSSYDRVKYARREGGSWTVNVAVDNAGSASWSGGRLLKGSSDRIHLFFKDDTNNDAYQRCLRSDNSLETFPSALDATVGIDAFVWMPGVSWDDGGTRRIRIPYANDSLQANLLKFDSADTPGSFAFDVDFSDAAVRDNGDAYEGALARTDEGDLYFIYVNDSNADLYYAVDTGSGWAADTLYFAGTVNAVTVNSFTRAGNRKVAFMYQSGSTLVYDELDLGPAFASVSLAGSLPAMSGALNIDWPSKHLYGGLPAMSGALSFDWQSKHLYGALPAMSGAATVDAIFAQVTGSLPAPYGSLGGVNPAVEVLRPTGAGSLEEWHSVVGSADHWSAVDEVATDDEVSYVRYTGGSGLKFDKFAVANTALTTETIIAVTAKAITRIESAGTPTFRLGVRRDGTDETINAIQSSTVYREVTAGPLSRPGGGTWVVADLDDLELVFGIDAGESARVTSAWLEITYEAPALSFVTATGNLPAMSGALAVEWVNKYLTGALPAMSGALALIKTLKTLSGALPAMSGALTTEWVAKYLAGNLPAMSGTVADFFLKALAGDLPAMSGALVAEWISSHLYGDLPAMSGTISISSGVVLAGDLPAMSGALTPLFENKLIRGLLADWLGEVYPLQFHVHLAGDLPAMSGTIAGVVGQVVTLTGSLPAMSGLLTPEWVNKYLTGNLPEMSGALGPTLLSTLLAGALPAMSGALTAEWANKLVTGILPAMSGTVDGEYRITVLGNLPAMSGALTALFANRLVNGNLPAMSGALTTLFVQKLIEGVLPAMSGVVTSPLSGLSLTRPGAGLSMIVQVPGAGLVMIERVPGTGLALPQLRPQPGLSRDARRPGAGYSTPTRRPQAGSSIRGE